MKKELIIKTHFDEKVYVVRNDESLERFIVTGTTIDSMKDYLWLRSVLAPIQTERTYYKMILTLFETLPVEVE